MFYFHDHKATKDRLRECIHFYYKVLSSHELAACHFLFLNTVQDRHNLDCSQKVKKPTYFCCAEFLAIEQKRARMSISSSERTLLAAIEMSLELDKSRAALLIASGTEKIIARRQIGLDKIIQLLNAYQAKDDTVAFAISIFDRWLASDLHNETADKHALTDACECYAMACFLIAMKFREVESPALLDMAHDGWLPAHIASCEQEVLFSLDWNVHSTTGIDHFRQYQLKITCGLLHISTCHSIKLSKRVPLPQPSRSRPPWSNPQRPRASSSTSSSSSPTASPTCCGTPAATWPPPPCSSRNVSAATTARDLPRRCALARAPSCCGTRTSAWSGGYLLRRAHDVALSRLYYTAVFFSRCFAATEDGARRADACRSEHCGGILNRHRGGSPNRHWRCKAEAPAAVHGAQLPRGDGRRGGIRRGGPGSAVAGPPAGPSRRLVKTQCRGRNNRDPGSRAIQSQYNVAIRHRDSTSRFDIAIRHRNSTSQCDIAIQNQPHACATAQRRGARPGARPMPSHC